MVVYQDELVFSLVLSESRSKIIFIGAIAYHRRKSFQVRTVYQDNLVVSFVLSESGQFSSFIEQKRIKRMKFFQSRIVYLYNVVISCIRSESGQASIFKWTVAYQICEVFSLELSVSYYKVYFITSKCISMQKLSHTKQVYLLWLFIAFMESVSIHVIRARVFSVSVNNSFCIEGKCINIP